MTKIKIKIKKKNCDNLELKDKVEHVLANYPETRESDNVLIFKVWAEFQPELLFKICLKIIRSCYEGSNTFNLSKMEIPEEVKYLDNPKTITRWRRWFNNELGLYLPPKEVQERRRQAEEDWKERILCEKRELEC